MSIMQSKHVEASFIVKWNYSEALRTLPLIENRVSVHRDHGVVPRQIDEVIEGQ
jgi:hypothetical protein